MTTPATALILKLREIDDQRRDFHKFMRKQQNWAIAEVDALLERFGGGGVNRGDLSNMSTDGVAILLHCAVVGRNVRAERLINHRLEDLRGAGEADSE